MVKVGVVVDERRGVWRAVVGCAEVAVVTRLDVLVTALQEDMWAEEGQRLSSMEDRVMEEVEESGRGCLTLLCLSAVLGGTDTVFSSFVIL